MRRGRVATLALAAIGLAFSAVASSRATAQVVTPLYRYFPSPSTTDGKFLAIAGTGIQTLAGQSISIGLAVPRTSASFEFGLFDGEAGGMWDEGGTPVVYTLYADPTGNPVDWVQVGQWDTSVVAMPDNDWYNITSPTHAAAKSPVSGHYFYVVQVTMPNPGVGAISCFKLRTTATIKLEAQSIGLYTKFGTAEAAIHTPSYPTAAPVYPYTTGTTYNGAWDFEMDVPAPTSYFTVWDGDLDHGNADGSDPDTNDPDTPAVYNYTGGGSGSVPEWAVGTPAIAQGVTGADPRDDFAGPYKRRSPSIRYEVVAPDGTVYKNDNPTGDLEWEQFRLTSDPAATRSDADYAPNVSSDGSTFVPAAYATTGLPTGIYKIHLIGMDMGNLNTYRFFHEALGQDPEGKPVRPVRRYFVVGDRVWNDLDGNGLQDSGEPGIPNVLLNFKDGSGQVIGSAGTDANGIYEFGAEPGINYTVEVAPANYQPGGALVGLVNTTATTQPAPLKVVSGQPTDNLDVDFGFWNPPPSIQCPANVTTTTTADTCTGLANVGAATATDNTSVTITGTRSDGQALNAPYPVGTTVIVWTATDAGGKQVSCSQTVAVRDAQPPSPVCPGNIAPSACGSQVVTFDVSATDNCGDVTVTAVPPSGSTFPVGTSTVVVTAVDGAGNTANCTFDVTILSCSSPGTGTPGYWKNHSWPVGGITIGGRTYTRSQAVALFPGNTEKKAGDKSRDMFAQLVSAKLNLMIGNDASCISSTISQADAWMAQYPAGSNVDASSAAWTVGGPLHTRLDDYNNGRLCAPHRG